MPRKSQRSQAQKLRWQKEKRSQSDQVTGTDSENNKQQFQNIPYTDVAQRQLARDGMCVGECFERQQVNDRSGNSLSSVVALSDGNTAQTAFQHDAGDTKQSASQVSYADMVKRGCGSAQQSRVNAELQPSVTHVCASRSQDSLKYGKYRNSQCMANSLVFLAFFHENEMITRPDLDLVLDKGDAVYRQARERFPRSIHLATDELPNEVSARRSTYQVDMTPLPVCGTFGGGQTYPSLEEALSHLSSDVQYGLLIMSGLCIAVFRSRSGEYGYFDPHTRNKNGMPVTFSLLNFGTAVMLKFAHLTDMIQRLKSIYTMLNVPSSCVFELQPLSFYQRDASDTVGTSPLLPESDTPSAVQHEVESASLAQNIPGLESNINVEVMSPVESCSSDDVIEGASNAVSFMSSVTQENTVLPISSETRKMQQVYFWKCL
ncbi:uncharacterized protein LOC106938453 [Poecilia latipinna]|uniref:uncharacterized protein LOC106938453 n=1 Tax=Poecilia latipinna TaxID=48699 RepID=UPI00072E5B6A|nr:PREDICTED: uncharacterized protein LOC106938453 [Poecilia latipinna]